MIRTNSVSLSILPAVAYRQKIASGGSGIVIVRSDATQPGIASISKTSREPIISANTPADLYPKEAFDEAITLTAGMPYRRQGKPKPTFVETEDEPAPVIEDEPPRGRGGRGQRRVSEAGRRLHRQGRPPLLCPA